MSDTEPDDTLYARDLDGTGSPHVCSKEDPGARLYIREDADQSSPEDLQPLRGAVLAADRFFREAMPQINIADSCLDANAIDAWNKAELAISKAMRLALGEKENPDGTT